MPLIVDAAAEEDLSNTPKQALIWGLGGAKAIEGPSAGLVVGKKNTLTGCAYKARHWSSNENWQRQYPGLYANGGKMAAHGSESGLRCKNA